MYVKASDGYCHPDNRQTVQIHSPKETDWKIPNSKSGNCWKSHIQDYILVSISQITFTCTLMSLISQNFHFLIYDHTESS